MAPASQRFMEIVDRVPSTRLPQAADILPSPGFFPLSRIKALKKPTILIFEESREMQEHYSQFLRADYNLLMVETARYGIQMLQSTQIDLILFNIELKREVEAVDMLRVFRRLAAGALIPVVAMTGYSGSCERELLSNAKFDAYVSRPFTLRKLQEVINRCMARRTVSIMNTVNLDLVKPETVKSGSRQPVRQKTQPVLFPSLHPGSAPQP